MNDWQPRSECFFRIAMRCLPAIGLSSTAIPTSAFAKTTSEITLSASTGFDSNPFLGVDNNREVASFRLELAPTVSYSDGLSNLTVRARAEHIEYLGKFGSVQNLSTSVTAEHRLNARTTIAASVAIASGVSITDFTGLPLTSGQPTGPILPDVTPNDITILGRQTRRNSVSTNGSIVFQPSQYDQLSFSSSLDFERYAKNSGLDDYDFASHQIAYSRRINEQISVGGMFEASVGDFKYIRFGDARIFSPKFIVKARLNSRFDFDAAIGASFARIETVGGDRNVTALAGSAALCYRGALNNFCLNGQRQVLPTAVGDVRTISSLGTNYSVRLSSRDTFQSGASFTTASAPSAGGTDKLESVRLFGRLERRLSERARIYASGSYANTSDEIFAKRTNLQAALGITLTFGKL